MTKSNEESYAKRLVDYDTGEYVDIYEGDEWFVVRKEQKEAIVKAKKTKVIKTELKQWNNNLGGFIFVLFEYGDDILKQHPSITSEDMVKLFYLATYVNYEGYLIYKEDFMTRKDMNTILDIHINTFDTFFNKMKKESIFIQEPNKSIKINGEYFIKGKIDKKIKNNYDYTRLYINTIRYLFENVPKNKHYHLGNCFKIIPYIHRQQNVLCWNPDGKKNEIQLMHVSDLRKILGCHRQTIPKFIREMLSIRLENNQAIMGFFRTEYDEGKSYIIINPRVFYGGNFEVGKSKDDVIKWF